MHEASTSPHGVQIPMRVLGGTAGNKTPEIHQYNVQFANEKIPVALKKAILDGCQESHFNGSYLFDNKKTLYCTKKFTDSRMVMFPEVMGNFPAHHAPYYPDPCPKEMEKRKVELVYEKTISPSDCVWIYDLIFKKCLYGIGFTPIGRTFYDSYATLEYPHLGLQFWPGYDAKVTAGKEGLSICMDTVNTVVHNENLLKTLCNLKIAHAHLYSPKPSLKDFILEELKNCSVISQCTNQCTQIEDILFGTTPKSDVKQGYGQKTYYEFYKDKYNVRIKHMNQPLLRGRSQGSQKEDLILIPELCVIMGPNEKVRSNTDAIEEIGKYLDISQEERLRKVLEIIARVQNSEKAREQLRAWGLTFDTEPVSNTSSQVQPTIRPNELPSSSPLNLPITQNALTPECSHIEASTSLEKPERFELEQNKSVDKPEIPVLEPSTSVEKPEISVLEPSSSQQESASPVLPPKEKVTTPKCMVSFRPKPSIKAIANNKATFFSVPLKKWVVLAYKHDVQLITKFIDKMIQMAAPLAFDISFPLEIEKLPDQKPISYIQALDSLLLKHQGDFQIVLCILPNTKRKVYQAVKDYLSSLAGLPSQCIVKKTIIKHMRLASQRVIIQMNTKLGGEPWTAQLPPEFQLTSMAIGFDFSGTTVKKGVVVATTNAEYSRYCVKTFTYDGLSQLNISLMKHFKDCLDAYIEVNGQLPINIVFFRNTVQEDKAMLNDIEPTPDFVINALNMLTLTQGIRLVFIALTKRNLTKMASTIQENKVPFPDEQEDDENPKHESFVVPYVLRVRDVRSLHYRILRNPNNVPAAILEAFSYKLCHLYCDWAGTVNLPCVVQYAAKLAKGRKVKLSANNTALSEVENILTIL